MENKEVRVNIRISSETKKFFEELSKEVGAPQSSLMAMALKEYIDQKRTIRILPELMEQFEEMQEMLKGGINIEQNETRKETTQHK